MVTWDTAGQEKFKSLSTTYYRKSNGALFVYDLSMPETLHNHETWITNFMDQQEPGAEIVVMFIGNKSDLVDDVDEASKEGMKFAQEKGFLYATTSALDYESVSGAFKCLILHMIQKDDAEREVIVF